MLKPLLLSLCCLAGTAAAQDGGASFTCGGVGTGEQARMKAAAASHDAMLTFAVDNGAYLADVDVRITDARGRTVLDANCDGPIMLLNLPGSGTFTVRATAEGEARTRTIRVGDELARAVFVWPAS